MTISPEISRQFPDLQKSQQALRRAAERARRLAEQTGTRLIVDEKGEAASSRPESTVAGAPQKQP